MENPHSQHGSLVEIGLLAFFVLALAAAQLVVKVRQRVILSPPIALTGAGLSVTQPINAGWESTPQWQYETDNSLILVAQQFQGTAREVEIRWRYQLCSAETDAEALLARRLEQAGRTLGEIRLLDGPVPMAYAAIQPPDGSGRTFYVGMAPLEFGRSIELQVLPGRVSDDYAQTLFRTLAASMRYDSPAQLQHGQALVETLWPRLGDDAAAAPQTFVIRDMQQTPVGYFYTEPAPAGEDDALSVRIRSRHVETNRSRVESSLAADADGTFTWQSTIQQLQMGRPRTYAIRHADGEVAVTLDAADHRRFPANCLLVPELLVPQAAALFLEQPEQSAVVDVLSGTGYVVPTLLEKIDPPNALGKSDDIDRVVRVDFLNHADSFEELYFNAAGTLIGRLEQQPRRRPRLWEQTTREQLQRLFDDPLTGAAETVVRAGNE